MATISYVEGQIKRLEGFAVRIRFAGPGGAKGRDVRGDKAQIAGYPYRRKRPDEHSVADWVSGRFRTTYPGFQVDVLDTDGNTVHGRKKLGNLRSEYGS
ncbi:MAG TPA: hypothetical protein VK507_09170 [Iamia sp.]|nr:hypothetical protein [Iamia sp.]